MQTWISTIMTPILEYLNLITHIMYAWGRKKDVFSSTFPSEYKFACSCYSFFRIAGESLLYKKSKN